MGKTIAASITIFALMVVFSVFMNIYIVISREEALNQVDEFLAKKVSIHRGFTPEVEAELQQLLSQLHLDYGDFDFSGTTTEVLQWGETARIHYTYDGNFVQKVMDYLGLPHVSTKPRDFYIVVTGR